MKEKSAIIEEMSQALKEETEKRKKHILKRTVPEERTLKNMLFSLTRQELDDIRYNLGLSGMNSLKKAELVDKLVVTLVDFSKTWFVTLLDEQYQAVKHIVENSGISTDFREDEMRLDYFQSIGVMGSGSLQGKLAWYIPDELMIEFKKLDNASFRKEVELNTEILRIATGILFFCGVMEFDKLFAKVKKYMELTDELSYDDFMRVLFNGSCWQRHILSTDRLMYYHLVVDPEKIFAEQQQVKLGYAELSYTEIYEAGVENYIDSTDAFKLLAQFFMKHYEYDVIKAADVTGKIRFILQNGGQMKSVVSLLDSLGLLKKDELGQEIVKLLTDFHTTMHLWTLRGHTLNELMPGKNRKMASK